MKTLFLFLALFAGQAYGADKALTLEQYGLQRSFDKSSKEEGWTFEYDVTQLGRAGVKKPDGSYFYGYLGPSKAKPIHILGEDEKLKSFGLKDFGKVLWKTMNQGACGSCVVFSTTLNFMNALILHGVGLPSTGLSPQHLMNCGTGGQCNGAYGEQIFEDLVKLKQLHEEKDYPYTASTGSCKTKPGILWGKVAGYKTIDGSVRSMLAALHQGYPISAGVAADSAWSSYSSGVYNRVGSMSTNHYIDIEEIDCETSVDKDGYCVFDKDGELPPGVGKLLIHNSWGNWGINGGYMWSKITSSSGKRINNIAGGEGNAQILDIGIPIPEDKPVTFVIENGSVKLTVTVQPGVKDYTVSEAKKSLENAISVVGDE